MAGETCPHCEEMIAADSEACPACGYLLVDTVCEKHPEREADGLCVICGRAVCEECNQPQGRHFVCEEHADVPLISGWAQVYSAADDVQAELIRENLIAEGISARVLSQRDHFSFSVDLGDLNQVRVLVPAYDYQAARQLIATHRDSEGEVAFACPACGEAYEPGDISCAACGTPLSATTGSA
jgi:hypothetical protein